MNNSNASKFSGMFQSLVMNALDFLERSVEELESNPKYSVIHFCSGIEIFLKARLMLEHWSLIVADKIPNFDLFKDGRSTTIGIQEAIKLIEGVLGVKVNEKARDCFIQISNHRNRIIHFYHNNDKNNLDDIVSEQCRGWFYLYDLLHNNFKEEFKDFEQRIQQINSLMLNNRRFLEKKFQALSDELAYLRKHKSVVQCKVCEFEAALENGNPPLADTECLVCEASLKLYKFCCSNCKSINYFDVEDEIASDKCTKCHSPFSVNNLVEGGFSVEQLKAVGYSLGEIVDSNSFDPDDILQVFDAGFSDYDDITSAYCPECQHENPSVVPNGNDWLCVSCGKSFNSVSRCEWCFEPVAGELEDSGIYGCGVFDCEGSWGYQMSKDD